MARGRIDYLRVSVTDRCNFRCGYCMPPQGVAFREPAGILSYEEIERFTRVAAGLGVTRVRVTGGEPLVRSGCAELVGMLARIPGVTDLALTTNGSRLEEQAPALRAAGLGRVNVSINSLDPARFAAVTGGGRLDPVLRGLRAAIAAGFAPVKVNVVMLAGVEGDLEGFIRLARTEPIHLRFIEQMPLGPRAGAGGDFIPRGLLLERLRRFGRLEPAPSPGGAGPARHFRLDGVPGTIGFISAMSDHICGNCNRIRLTADGRLRNCLFSREEFDVRPLINGGAGVLGRAILASMNSKKYDRRLVRPGGRTMSQLGG